MAKALPLGLTKFPACFSDPTAAPGREFEQAAAKPRRAAERFAPPSSGAAGP
jgi:hypothetical protein